jgi:5,10-methylenetetrahydromethanopterin reductase
MKIGFAHIPRFGFASTVDLICSAEAWGYDSAWVPDQAFFLDPYPLLTAAAARTKRISLGVGVTNPYARHPVLTARLAATVSEAADGRFRLGLGTGNRREYLQPLGHDGLHGPDICRTAIKIMRELLGGGTVRHRSEHLVADGVALSFAARGDLPIYLAGIGPKVVEVAGECADGAIISFGSEAGFAAMLEHLTRGRDKSPTGGASEVVALAIGFVTDDRAAAYDRLRPFIAHAIAPAPDATLRAIGFTDDQVATIREVYWSQGPEMAAAHVTDEMIDHWSWIGSPSQIVEKIQPLRDLGATEVIFVSLSNDYAELVAAVRGFGEDVGPMLR